MPSQTPNGQPNEDGDATGDINPDAEFAQAFKDLARGEQTATALENQLSSIELKIEELLARADKDQKELEDSVRQRQQQSSASIEPSDKQNGQK